MDLFNRKRIKALQERLRDYEGIIENMSKGNDCYEKMKYAVERSYITKAEFRQYLKESTGVNIEPTLPLGLTNENDDRPRKAMPNFRNPLNNYDKVVNGDGLLSPQKPTRGVKNNEA